MIGEIIKAPKGTRNSAKGLINYITGVTKSGDDAVDFVAAKNIIDKETAIAEMNAVVAQNIRTKNPFMHFVLSWKEHEKPSIPKAIEKESYRDPEKRNHKRLIRKTEREDLYQRYLIQRNHQTSFYMQQKSLIWAKQKASEKQRYESFRKNMKIFKKETYTQSNLPKKVLIGLIARERAARKEALDTQIKKERAALRSKLQRQSSLSWRRWLELNAPHNHAAASALRGLRYRNRHNNSDEAQSQNKEVPKTALLSPTSHNHSNTAPGEPLQIADFGTKILFDNSIAYLRSDSSTAFIDTGYVISLHDRQDDSLQAALKVAKEKWAGGPLVLTGDENFKLQAAKIAVALNIEISNPELESYLSQLKRQRGQHQNNAGANTTHQTPMKIR